MLRRAEGAEIVTSFTDFQSQIEHITSIRDFPMFDGDFFPDQLQQLIMAPSPQAKEGKEGRESREGRQAMLDKLAGVPAASSSSSLGSLSAPGLHRQDSVALVEQIKKQAKQVRKRFLVATLNTARWRDATLPEAEPEVSNDLVDSRFLFLGRCQADHWQCDQLHRAHYTTMMLLARLGGMDPPGAVSAAGVASAATQVVKSET